MKKIITLSLVSALSAFLLIGCASKSSSDGHIELGTPGNPNAHKDDADFRHVCEFTHEDIYKKIKEAGEKDGWIMTEFKSNEFIAEKIDGDDAKSVTVTFHGHSVDVHPSDSDLEDAIKDALKH